MDRKALLKANQKLLKRRQEEGIVPSPKTASMDQAKLMKCVPNLKPPLVDDPAQALEPNPDWPPPSLRPAVHLSNLKRWEQFNWARHRQLAAAKAVIVDWYNDLPGSGALVLAGNVGCGKTHIAQALADLYGRWRLGFFEEIELAKTIQATYSDKSQSEEGVIREVLFKRELFILDDLGTYEISESNPGWIVNIYNRIFNDYLTVQEKPLLITTNLPMFGEASIENRIGARSFSRLCDALREKSRYVNLFEVPDYRIERFLNND